MKETDIVFVDVLIGCLGIGHRPRLKKIRFYGEMGVTHIWTLLSEKEGAGDIGRAVIAAGLGWEWLSLPGAGSPDQERLDEIKRSFETCRDLLANGAIVYLHCSAGIHRTGMIANAFLRFLGYAKEDSLEMLERMRSLTREGVGTDRLNWGDKHFGKS